MNEPLPHVLIAGCGYVGKRLALRLQAQFDVTGMVRTSASAMDLAALGIRAHILDLDRIRTATSVPERLDQAAIIYLAPPTPSGESDLRLDRFLQIASVPPRVFVYMSTTGVYGDTGGALVDESSPLEPRTERARRRVSAEEMTRVWCTERRIRRVILRVPGIYGPGRLPLDRLREREPVVREEDAGISNRIHVDDLVEACAVAVVNPEARGVYTISDGSSITSTAFLNAVADIAKLPRPPQVSMEEAQLTFSPSRLSFIDESRRVSNERMLKHLGVRLKYADYREGIKASLAEQSGIADSG